MRRFLILAAVTLPAAAVGAAPPDALKQIATGMWELEGQPGSRAPVRQCVTDVMALAQFEHRSRTCSRALLRKNGSSTTISYRCGPKDFGQTELNVITPRSLRISTQGISDQLPFNYVLQAHRVGECAKAAE